MSISWAKDLADMDVLLEETDVAVVASVKSIDQIEASNGFYWTHATIEVSEILKGEVPDSLSITTPGGYVPYDVYVEGIAPEAMEKADVDWTEEEKRNCVVKAQAEEQNLLQEGVEYILFLTKSDDGTYATVGSYHGIMRIDGEKVWRKENAGIFDKEEIMQSIRES